MSPTRRLPSPSMLAEPLESRRLFAAVAPTPAVDDDGTLVVLGTNKNDTIVVGLAAGGTAVQVTVNGAVTSVDLASITDGIRVDGLAGKDSITIDETNGPLDRRATLLGGNGHDTIVGGSGADAIDGGNGHDDLDGGADDDSLVGGNGKDSLDGDDGDDDVGGGNGRDSLVGGTGDDDLDGGAGRDALAGGAGNDDLDGGNGADDLDGGDDDDSLVGGSGDDDITGGNGTDTFAQGDDDDEVDDRGTDDDDDLIVTTAELPPAVLANLNTALADLAPFTVTEIELETDDDDPPVYEIDFVFGQGGGNAGTIHFAPDGTQIGEPTIELV